VTFIEDNQLSLEDAGTPLLANQGVRGGTEISKQCRCSREKNGSQSLFRH